MKKKFNNEDYVEVSKEWLAKHKCTFISYLLDTCVVDDKIVMFTDGYGEYTYEDPELDGMPLNESHDVKHLSDRNWRWIIPKAWWLREQEMISVLL